MKQSRVRSNRRPVRGGWAAVVVSMLFVGPAVACTPQPAPPTAVMGNGIVEPPEQCDDGNLVSGDGCSSTGQIEGVASPEGPPGSPSCSDGIDNDLNGLIDQADPGCIPVGEAEPNDTLATAQGPFPIGLGAVAGSIAPIGDADVFKVTTSVGGSVTFEVRDATGASCLGIDTVLRLYDPSGTLIGSDDDSGIDLCSKIDPAVDTWAQGLAGGVYYVSVRQKGDAAVIPGYVLFGHTT